MKEGIKGVAALKKHDIKIHSIVFMLYCLVCAGAFGIEEMIPKLGPGLTVVLLIVFPFIWAYPLSNMVAECSSVLPSEGGIYVWVREAFGEFWGFQASWWRTVSMYISNGTFVVLAVDYASQIVPMSEFAVQMMKMLIILIFTVINLMGLKEVGKVSTFLSITIILAFILVCIVGFTNWHTNPIKPFICEGKNIVHSLGSGICICVWMYCAYECIANVSGEIKNPSVIPKGLLIATPLVALSYILPTVASLVCLPDGSWQLWSTGADLSSNSVGYSTVLTTYLGKAWGCIFLIVAFISQCAVFNTQLASGSRGFFVLADDNLYPPIFSKVSKKRGVPYVGILSLSIVALVFSHFDFSTLVGMEVMFILCNYILMSLAVIKLRKDIPIEKRKEKSLFIMPGGRMRLYLSCGIPILISTLCLLINGVNYFVIGILAVSTGPFIYVIMKIKYGGLNKIYPKRYKLNKKTKLAVGDLLRISIYFAIIGAFSVFAYYWFMWYEVRLENINTQNYEILGNNISHVLFVLKYLGLLVFLFSTFSILLIYKRRTIVSLFKSKRKCAVKNNDIQ